MIPILYAKNASSFDNNGIGVLKDAVSCVVTEERNGAYTLTLKYPLSGNWYGEIKEGSIVKAKANETSDPQLFRIEKSSKPAKGIVTFSANHISYDLSGLPLMSLSLEDTTAAAAMTAGFAACPIQHNFNAWSDKAILKDIEIASPRSLRSFIGGQAGSILEQYAGELEFDNFTVKLHVNRGSDNGVSIAYGKNLTDAKQEQNIESCYTHLCPFAIKTVDTYNDDGEIIDQEEVTVKLTEDVIALTDPHNIGHSRALILDMTDQFDEDEEITEAALRTKANAYIASHELGTPEVNITVSFIQIWDTPEYKDFAALERVRLCDTVTVRFEALGIDTKAKIIKTVYDSLNERYTSLTIGSAKASLSDTFKAIEEKLDEEERATNDNKKASDVALNNAIIEATNKITGNAGGYVVLHPANYPSEILIMNTNDISTATKVWRWNSSGLGYSSTGYNGTYGLAMTIDGSIVADYITTGTLSAITVSGCTITGGSLNIGSGKFEVDSSGNIHAEGYIKATSGVIGGCSIVSGVLQVPAANVTGQLVASQINATNLHVSAANVDGQLVASQIDATNLQVAAANITGTLTIGQLPNTVAEVSDIPTNNNQLTNGAGYQTSANVVSIIDGRITAAYIEALSIDVGAAQITGQLTASQIDATGITATGVDITGKITATSGEISNLTITGKLKFGGNNSYYIDPNYSDNSYYINLPGFRVDDASGAVFSGKLNAPSGNIGGCSIVNGVLQVPVANIIGTITATELEVKNGSYTYFYAGNSTVQIAGFHADNNSLYSGSTFSNSAVFLCTGSTGYLTIGGHYGTNWGLKVGTKFGVNTSGELYCTSAHLTGSIDATSGKIGNETYNFTIGASGSSASLYCGTSSLAGTGGLGATSNQIYIGTDGLSFQIENQNANYTTVLRSGLVITYGDDSRSGNYNRGVETHMSGLRFFNSGNKKIGSLPSVLSYVIAEIELQANKQYALLSGTWKSTNSIAVISDRNAKNTIENIDSRYIDLIDRLTPRRYRYNDGRSGRFHTGFIAQEVKDAMEAAGLTEQELAALCYDNIGQEGESWSLRYEELIAPMIAKIKALEARIAALEG